jgi:hypothetical protein
VLLVELLWIFFLILYIHIFIHNVLHILTFNLLLIYFQRLLEKMASKKQTGLSFKFLFFMLCSILAAFVYFDIRREGSWQSMLQWSCNLLIFIINSLDSNINRILKNWGVCEYTHIILHRIKQGLLLINDQLEENFPVYYHIIANFLEPYIELLRNLGYILYNIFHDVQETVLEKYPVVLQSVSYFFFIYIYHVLRPFIYI